MTLQQKFERFHAAHPQVYTEFCRRVEQIQARGISHYSADAIMQVVRFHTDIDGRPDEPFKVNNNYVRFYADLWLEEHPQHSDFFSTRKRPSEIAA